MSSKYKNSTVNDDLLLTLINSTFQEDEGNEIVTLDTYNEKYKGKGHLQQILDMDYFYSFSLGRGEVPSESSSSQRARSRRNSQSDLSSFTSDSQSQLSSRSEMSIDTVAVKLPKPGHFFIYVEKLSWDQKIILECKSSDTVSSVKKMIEDLEGFPVGQQRLFSPEKELLEDERTLESYEIQEKSIKNYLHLSTRDPTSTSPFTMCVKTETGGCFSVKCTSSDTIEAVKARIQDIAKFRPFEYHLLFDGGVRLADINTLQDYDITEDVVVHHYLNRTGGGGGGPPPKLVYLPDQFRAPEYDFDFTNLKDTRRTFKRGDVVYKRPAGCWRIALKVLGKYEDDEWLGIETIKRKRDTDSSNGEWPVSYHGTGKRNLKSIAQDGYDLSKGKRFLFGRGIYSTPDIAVAELYATEFRHEGQKYKFVIQNRVNPATRFVVSKERSGQGEYWVHLLQNDVRPYGICIRKC